MQVSSKHTITLGVRELITYHKDVAVFNLDEQKMAQHSGLRKAFFEKDQVKRVIKRVGYFLPKPLSSLLFSCFLILGAWSSLNAFANPNVSNVITTWDAKTHIGSVTIIDEASGGCLMNATITAQECSPGTLTYTFTETGGDATAWFWDWNIINGGGTFISDQQNFTYNTPVGQELEPLIALTITCADGTMVSEDIPWTLLPPATAIASSNSPVVESATIELMESSGEAVSWSWSGPNGFNAVDQNPIINNATPAMAGDYTVTITTASGCTAEATTTVMVNAAGPCNINATITAQECTPGTLTYTLNENGGDAVSWFWSWSIINGGGTAFSDQQAFSFNSLELEPLINLAITCADGTMVLEDIPWTLLPPATAMASSNSPVVESETLELMESGGEAVSWSWSGPNGYNSVDQNPIINNVTQAMAGDYTVTITTATGCTAESTTTVVVDPGCGMTCPMAVGPFVADDCVEYTVTEADLNLSLDAGWSVINISPTDFTSAGVFDVVVTAQDGNGASCECTIDVAIDPPVPYTITSTLLTLESCVGGSVSFMDADLLANVTVSNGHPVEIEQVFPLNPADGTLDDDGNGNYIWNPSTPFPTSMGLLYVIRPVDNCPNITVNGEVTVNVTAPMVNVMANSPILEGNDILLEENGGEAISWSWTGPNGYTSNEQTPIIPDATIAMSGDYTVVVTGADGCTATATTNVLVSDCPVPAISASSNSPVPLGGNIELIESGGDAVSWSWTGPNGFTSDLQDPIIPNATLAMSGTYEITIMNASGCAAITSIDVIVEADDCVYTIDTPPIVFETCVGGTATFTDADFLANVTVSDGHPVEIQQVYLNNPSDGAFTDLGNGTYTFEPSPPFPTSVDFTYVVVPVDNCPAGFQSIGIMDVEVNAPLINMASNSPLEEGQTINLTEDAGEAVSWMWTGPDGFTSNEQNPTIVNALSTMAGIYELTVTDINGCTSSAATPVVVNAVDCVPPVLNVSSNSPIVEGEDIILMETGGETLFWFWVGPNNFSSTEQNPIITNAELAATGEYMLFATGVGSCSTTATVLVNVNPATCPPVASPMSSGDVCPGETVQLFANTNLGVNSTYSWIGPNGFSSTEENPLLNPAVGGTYFLTAQNGSCTASGQIEVTVLDDNLTAEVLGGDCPDGNLTLSTNISSPNATYSWTGPNGFTSSEEIPVITGVTTAAAGTYSVTVSIGSNCMDDASVDVTIDAGNANIVPTSNSPVCTGLNLNLMAPNGSGFTWSGPDGFNSTEQNPVITAAQPAASGTYTLMMTDEYNCFGSSDITVEVGDDLTALPTSSGDVCAGENVQLMANTDLGAGSTYSWTGPNSYTSTEVDPLLSPATGGTYALIVQNGSCMASGQIEVTVLDDNLTAEVLGGDCPDGNLTLSTNISSPNATYSWTGPNGFTSSEEIPVITGVTTAAAGTYSVTVSIGSNCMDDASVDVAIDAGNANIVPTSNSPVCTGLNLNLMAPNGSGFTWSGPDGFNSTEQNPVITAAQPAASGTYTLMMTDQYNCFGSSDITVEVGDDLTITPQNNGTVCPNTNLNLEVVGFGSGATYSWTGPNGFTSSEQNPVIAMATSINSGVYELTAINGSCMASGSTTAEVLDMDPMPIVELNSTFCEGNELTMSSTPAYTNAMYSWTGPDNFSQSGESYTIPALMTNQSGQYNLEVTLDAGCSGAAMFDITINPSPAVMANSDGPVCADGILSLEENGGLATSWEWSGGSFFSSEQNPVVDASSLVGVTEVQLVGFNNTGCTDTLLLPIEIDTLPVPVITGLDSTYCNSASTSIMLTGNFNGGMYSITAPGDAALNDQNNGSAILTPAQLAVGDYTITYNYETINGCAGETTAFFEVYDKPAINLTQTGKACDDFSDVMLAEDAGAAVSWEWTGPGGFMTTEQNILLPTLFAEGTYEVIVTDQFGCVNTADTLVEVFMGMAFTANFLTPTQACVGDSVHFFEISETSINPSSIIWDFGDGNTSTERDPIHQFAAGGQYQVMVEVFDDECGNVSLTKPIDVVVCIRQGSDLIFNEIKTFPNPAQEVVTIDVDLLIEGGVLMSVFSAQGQKIHNRFVDGKASYSETFAFDLPGVYFVHVRSTLTNSNEVRKIVITK